jgi:glycosyltransferase involved in cell wall biosynthesis
MIESSLTGGWILCSTPGSGSAMSVPDVTCVCCWWVPVNSIGTERGVVALQLLDVLWVDRFVHHRDEMRRYLSAGDVYAFPSRNDGFPTAPIEGMACGLPVVADDAQRAPTSSRPVKPQRGC